MNILPISQEAGKFVELRFKPGSWARSGIPEVGCRIRQATLEKLLEQNGVFQITDLILGLMDWLDVTGQPAPALATLREMLARHYPADGQITSRCHFVDEGGVENVFHAGPLDLAAPLVTWQRRDWIVAGAQPSAELGRIVVGAPGPISTSTALSILSLSATSYMGESFDSWSGALNSCGRTAVFYRWEAGEVTPILFDRGLGRGARTSISKLKWLAPNQLAMQVAIAGGYRV